MHNSAPSATIIGNVQPGSCGKANASFDLSKPYRLSACRSAGYRNPAERLPKVLEPPNCLISGGGRNQYRGPHYFDMDLNLFKNFKVGERVNFAIGAQAFNVFNHPNFGFRTLRTFTAAPIRSRRKSHHAVESYQPLWKLPWLRLVSARYATQREDRVLAKWKPQGPAERSALFLVADRPSGTHIGGGFALIYNSAHLSI